MNIHTMNNGATILSTSPHGFKFSDGTECLGNPELATLLTLERQNKEVTTIKGMRVNQVQMILSPKQVHLLAELAAMVDIVIIPFPVLTALREQELRDRLPNCLAFNATAETQRSAPQDKVVDIGNWSY